MPTIAPPHPLPAQLTFSWAEPETTSTRAPKPSTRRVLSKQRVTSPSRDATNRSLTTPPRVLPSTAPAPLTLPSSDVAPPTPTSRLAKTTHVSDLMELVLARYGITRDEIEAELARS